VLIKEMIGCIQDNGCAVDPHDCPVEEPEISDYGTLAEVK